MDHGMTVDRYARPTLDIAREQITMLLDAYQDATGFSPTFVGRVARGDPKFARQYLATGFTFRSFDLVNSRLSAVWPEGLPWPAEVPRQAPGEVEPELLEKIRERTRPDVRGQGAAPLPAGESWPEDIPPPSIGGGQSSTHGGTADG